MSIEAMKQALEALEEAHPKPYNESVITHFEAIVSLRQAIAETEKQEQNFCPRCGKRTNDIHTCTPPQRTWVGLTDEEIIQIVNANSSKGLYLMAKAIKVKLKERNEHSI